MTTIPCTSQRPQTVKVCYFLLIAILGPLTGCQNPQTGSDTTDNSVNAVKLPTLPAADVSRTDQVPHSVPEVETDLSRFQVPETLAGLKLDGEISSDNARTLRYMGEAKKESLQLVIRGLPAGWDTMSPERAVASYYSEVRQRRVQRALSDPANALSILSETLLDLEGEPAAQAQMRWVEPGKPIQSQSLLITLYDGAFVRISNASYQQNPRWLLQQAKRGLAEFKAAQE